MSIVVFLIGIFLLLAFLGVPVGFAIGLASLAFLLKDGSIPLMIIPQKIYAGMNSFTLMAIPFFMLAGVIMDKSGLTKRLVNFADALLGWLTCGLCYAAALSGIFMGGISGSAPADTAALGSVLIPSMKEKGYPVPFSAALMAASGAIGIIIPPSIPMVVLASCASISIGRLFMGGIIPGCLVGLGLMVTSRIICGWKYGITDRTPFTFRNLWTTFKASILALLAPIIIVGGIATGYFSATESSVVVVVYTAILGLFVYKSIHFSDLIDICVGALKNTANVMLVIGTSTIFSWLLTRNNVPQQLADAIMSISSSPLFVLFIINVIVIISGMFLDGLPIIIMLVPILLPIAQAVGIDPIVFSVMFIINLAIGGMTPPVGATLFVSSMTAGVKVGKTAKAAIPFEIALLAVLIIILIIPQLVLFVPNLLV